MPFDAVLLSAVAEELRTSIIPSKIDKIQQPARDTLILQLRCPTGNRRLLLTANPNHARVQLTETVPENPASPPMFCMLLRKHLTGGRLSEITQPPMERVLDFCFACTDEMGVPCEKHVILELMGRVSNLIVTGADGRILDCLRHVDLESSEQRQLLPGLYYHLPEPLPKKNSLLLSETELCALLKSQEAPMRLDKWLLNTCAGLSPLVCRELSFRVMGAADAVFSSADADALSSPLFEALSLLRQRTPTLLSEGGVPKDFSFLPILQYEGFYEQASFPSFSLLLDAFYGKRDQEERIRQKSQQLKKQVQTLHDRTARKLELQKKELADSLDREALRRRGDIVTANLYRMQRGQTVLEAEDFYDPDMKKITIPLSPQLSPQQNAARFYRDYAKAKNAEKILTEQIARGETERTYLASVLDELLRAESERDLNEIRAELQDGGYVRNRDGKKKLKQPPTAPMAFCSSEGFSILVGRNNRQNDLLTLKTAGKTDIFLHTQKIHGSHAVIFCGGKTPGDQTMTEAAQLAAYYSQARQGQNVPVDTTMIRNVKKPAGAKPGMVVYDRYTTLYVTPDEGLCDRLRTK